VAFFSATFLQPWSCYASPYSGCKNVSYLERYAKIAQNDCEFNVKINKE